MVDRMSSKLMPLKIPSTWAVIYNSFADEDLIIQDKRISNSNFYQEDLLSIERIFFVDNIWHTLPMGHVLDLGWYPGADPNGRYRLTLLRGDWDNVILQFESKDRQRIREVVEQCLELVIQEIDDQNIPHAISY
jgi:hypothetical protein